LQAHTLLLITCILHLRAYDAKCSRRKSDRRGVRGAEADTVLVLIY